MGKLTTPTPSLDLFFFQVEKGAARAAAARSAGRVVTAGWESKKLFVRTPVG